MKWKNHKYAKISNGEYIYDLPGRNTLELKKDEGYGSKEISIKSQYGKGEWDFNRRGVERVKNQNKNEIAYYNTANTKYFDDGERATKKRIGPVQVSYAEDGARYAIQFNKKHKKKTIKSISRSTMNNGKNAVSNAIRKARFQHSYRKAARSQKK